MNALSATRSSAANTPTTVGKHTYREREKEKDRGREPRRARRERRLLSRAPRRVDLSEGGKRGKTPRTAARSERIGRFLAKIGWATKGGDGG